MTSRQKLEEEFFTCVICHDLFRKPVTLHCNHHFCQECLTSYTNSRGDAVAVGCLPCASCRQLTKVPDPSKPVTEWAGQLKTGFFVQGLMDALGAAETASGTEESRTDVCEETLICGTHPGKQAELYCADCELTICSMCSGIDHRTCDSVVTAEEGAKMAGSKLEQRTKNIQENMKLLHANVEKNLAIIKQTEQRFDKVEAKIDQTCQAVIDRIFEEARSLKDALKTMKNTKIDGITIAVQNLEEQLRIQQMNQDETQEALKTSGLYRINACNKLSPMASMHTTITKSGDLEVEFEEHGQELGDAIKTIGIGRILTKSVTVKEMDMKKVKLVQIDAIDIQMSGDTSTPFVRDVIAGITLLGLNVIVVADSGNRCVKTFCHGTQSRLLLPANPCKMTKIDNDNAAVTLSNKSIFLFSFLPILGDTKIIKTAKSYYGITSLGNSTFAVSSVSSVCRCHK